MGRYQPVNHNDRLVWFVVSTRAGGSDWGKEFGKWTEGPTSYQSVVGSSHSDTYLLTETSFCSPEFEAGFNPKLGPTTQTFWSH